MRRQKSISIRVRAPSRGLITRLPGESADLLPSKGDVAIPSTLLSLGSLQRAASRASNVRYDNGVIRNAPGYSVIQVTNSTLSDVVARWSLDESSGTRFDTSGNDNNLTEQDGFDPFSGTTTVGITSGKFNGAALFTSLPYRAFESDSFSLHAGLSPSGSFPGGSFISIRTEWTGDAMSLSAGLAQSFQNPTLQQVFDGMKVFVGMQSGTYLLADITVNEGTDSMSVNGGFESGIYFPTIVTENTGFDSLSVTAGFDDGTYSLVIVTTTVPGDSMSVTAGFDDGAYTQTVFGNESVEDSMALTTGLESGSYS